MENKYVPTLSKSKINKDNFDFFYNVLPSKSEIIEGQIYFNDGEIKAEELLKALIYYIGMEKTVELVNDKDLWLNAIRNSKI